MCDENEKKKSEMNGTSLKKEGERKIKAKFSAEYKGKICIVQHFLVWRVDDIIYNKYVTGSVCDLNFNEFQVNPLEK